VKVLNEETGFTGTMIPPYKAYVTCNWVGASSPSSSFSVIIDDTIDETSTAPDDVTGVANVARSYDSQQLYDLSGRLIVDGTSPGKIQPGLYIRNGKKVVVK